MTALIIIASIVVFIVSIVYLVFLYRMNQMKKWKEGDKLKMSMFSEIGRYMSSKNIKHVTLLAWSHPREILVKIENRVHKIKYGDIDENASYERREMQTRIRETMKKPDFDLDELIEGSATTLNGNEFCDNIPIETMNEIQCEVYLKKALDHEQFEIAAEIRERLKRFR